MLARRRFRRSLAALAVMVLAAPADAQTMVLTGFTMIDGTGRPPVPHAAMVVTRGRIAWVGPAWRLKRPARATVVDLTGKYVLPGLIDTHVHLGLTAAGRTGDGLTVDAKNQTDANVERQLRIYARYGVTAVQSLGTDQDVVLRMRDAQRAGLPAESRIYSAGLGVVFEGGYGGLAGVTRKVATPAAADAAVAREVARHVDVIKLWLDTELGTMPRMPVAISAAVIDGAHARNLRAVAHIFYLEDARRLVAQGVDGLSHSVRDQPVDAALIGDMKRRGTWQMASTLSREQSLFVAGDPASLLGDPFFTQSVDPTTLAQLADPARGRRIATAPHFDELPGFLAMAMRNLKTLADAGVPYAMGTDAGGPGRFPGYAEHVELQLMVEAGLTPMQAIVASTASGARFLHAADLGTLEPGKLADMVVLDADPLIDIRNSRTISAVYIAGRRVPSITR